jgi:hypothetical protein
MDDAKKGPRTRPLRKPAPTDPGEFIGYADWFRSQCEMNEPWLILGKGPSFSKYLDLPEDHGYRTLGINNVCRLRPVFLTLIVDLHNVFQNDDVLFDNTQYLAMPWYPHVKNKPSRDSLAKLAPECGILRRLKKKGRLVTFNSTLSRQQKPGPGPWVHLRYFSGVAAVSMLGIMGVKTIRTLGIDDGSHEYYHKFSRHNLFLNGRESFSAQVPEIRKLVQKYQLDFARL